MTTVWTAWEGIRNDPHLNSEEMGERMKKPTEADLGAYSHVHIDWNFNACGSTLRSLNTNGII